MSIHFRPDRPDLPWQVRWREGGRQRSRAFPRGTSRDKPPRAALALEAEIARRAREGAFAPVEPSREPLHDWLRRWVEVHGQAWERSTLRQRGSMIDHDIIPFLGGTRLRDLGRAKVADYRRDLRAAGRSNATINTAVRVLSAALGKAVEEGLIPVNPCANLKPMPRPPTERRAIPLDSVEALRAAMPTPRDRLVVSLLAYAGVRPGELVALLHRDLDEHTIHVARAAADGGGIKRTKTGGSRVVPLRAEVARDLAAGAPDSPVVPGDRGGAIDWHNWTNRVWRPARASLGLDYVPYEARHTFASLCIAEGSSPVEVASWMGHASTKMTLDTYSHLFQRRC